MIERFPVLLLMPLLAVVLTVPALAEPLILEVSEASVGFDQRVKDLPVLSITFAPASREAFAHFTEANVGRKVEMRIEGKVVMAPVIREPILGGKVQVSGSSVGLEELRQVAKRLSGGSIKVEVEVVPD